MSTMTASPIEVMAHLYQEQALSNAELARKHHTLGKMYDKLAKVNQMLEQRQERQLSRKQKKKLQWTHAMTRRAAATLEQQTARLDDSLRRCNNLVASLSSSSGLTWPSGGCQYVPSALTSPCAPLFSPQHVPQLWGLSIIPSPNALSAHTSPVDSGFHDTTTGTIPVDVEVDSFEGEYYDYVGSLVARPQWTTTLTQRAPGKTSPPLAAPWKPTHQRCHSDGTAKAVDGRLAAPKIHRRGASAGPVLDERDNATQGAHPGVQANSVLKVDSDFEMA